MWIMVKTLHRLFILYSYYMIT